MPTRKAEAQWNGDLKTGNGSMKLGSGSYSGSYSFASRFKEGDGTNPEELIGAAHAGCFSMALAMELSEAGYDPGSIDTRSEVTFDVTDGEPAITGVTLITEADVPNIDKETFQEFANGAKEGCPISKALSGLEISLDATLR